MSGNSEMKKISVFFLLLIWLSLFCAAKADTWNDYEYEIRNDGAVILSYSGKESQLSLPLAFGSESVIGINSGAFENNNSVTQITMPSTIEFIGDRAFAGCINLSGLTVSSGLKNIGDEAFADCSSLSYFTLPANIETIGRKAFAGCTNLIYIQDLSGDSLYEIGGGAFDDTPWFMSIYGDYVTINQGRFLLKYRADADSFVMPWNIFYIAEDAFAWNNNLTSLTLSTSLVKLQYGSISHMASLTSVYSSVPVKTVDDGAFIDLPLLEIVSIRNDNLDCFAFIDCKKSPFGSESTGTYDRSRRDAADELFLSEYDAGTDGIVILHCKADAVFPDGVLTFPGVIRGKRVTSVGIGACQDRSDIRKVVFPKFLKEIQSWAFSWDSGLSEIVFSGKPERIDADAFTGCPVDEKSLDLEGVTVDERAFIKTGK